MSKTATKELSRLVAASIGVARPNDASQFGYLSEHHAFGQNQRFAGDYAEDLAAQMLGSTLGLDIDLDKAWDERKEEWRIADNIVKTTEITQTAVGRDGVWTTVVAAGVFCG